MTRFSLLCSIVVLAFTSNTALATSICPVMTGGNAGGGGGVNPTYIADSGGTDGGCNLLITFNANGSITTSRPNAATSYDGGGDDNLVGILNDSGHLISSITLAGATDPFGFDGDGACDPTWTFAGGNPCGTTTSGYGHSGVTFTAISGGTGTVHFAGGIPTGSGNWFSLEGPVDIHLRIVPEPSALLLLGTGLLGIGFSALRRRRS